MHLPVTPVALAVQQIARKKNKTVMITAVAVTEFTSKEKGGTLSFQARSATLAATPERAAGDYVCLAVTDSGVGMPPAVLARIFEPFFTTKELGKGTGPGLAQVHGFSKQSGGDIAVESAAGDGTTITIYLPRATPAAIAAAASSHTKDPASAHPMQEAAGRTVLVVEDNPDVATFAASMLEELGYTTRCAANADEALALLDTGEQVNAARTAMPSRSSSAAGPMPERCRIAGEWIAPAQNSTSCSAAAYAPARRSAPARRWHVVGCLRA